MFATGRSRWTLIWTMVRAGMSGSSGLQNFVMLTLNRSSKERAWEARIARAGISRHTCEGPSDSCDSHIRRPQSTGIHQGGDRNSWVIQAYLEEPLRFPAILTLGGRMQQKGGRQRRTQARLGASGHNSEDQFFSIPTLGREKQGRRLQDVGDGGFYVRRTLHVAADWTLGPGRAPWKAHHFHR